MLERYDPSPETLTEEYDVQVAADFVAQNETAYGEAHGNPFPTSDEEEAIKSAERVIQAAARERKKFMDNMNA